MRLAVEIWSDIACPWCYVGKRRFETALARFDHRDAIDLTWRAFELDPRAPRIRDATQSYASRLAEKYGMSVAQAESRIAQMVATAAAEGLEFHVDQIQSGNTFDAHRLIHLAGHHGLGGAAKERLLRAYFTEGQAVGEVATLQLLGRDLGLDGDEVDAMLAGDRFAGEVRAEQAEARDLGVSGVPFFVLGRQFGVSGAQPPEAILAALNQAWTALAPPPIARVADGPACGPDGC